MEADYGYTQEDLGFDEAQRDQFRRGLACIEILGRGDTGRGAWVRTGMAVANMIDRIRLTGIAFAAPDPDKVYPGLVHVHTEGDNEPR